MITTTFMHEEEDSPNTLSEIQRLNGLVAPSDFVGLYAYATLSGFASFNLGVGAGFWENTPSRWLFGFDYGRTQPQAIRSIIQKPNTQVRIFDGAWIVARDSFLPRRDFHAKLALMLNAELSRFGMVVGSGNFSSNGLRNSIEAGAALYATHEDEYNASFASSVDSANALWEDATPAENVLQAYEEKWLASSWRRIDDHDVVGVVEDAPPPAVFWIEAGYVTKNRGPNHPGNQVDFPRGMSRYFGFNPPENLPVKSVIGALTFLSPVGDAVTRNLRLGTNHMEKISLPVPEAHGFDMYDGKVLVFERADDAFRINALEVADFESAFGDKLVGVKAMAGGRRYGHVEHIVGHQ